MNNLLKYVITHFDNLQNKEASPQKEKVENIRRIFHRFDTIYEKVIPSKFMNKFLSGK